MWSVFFFFFLADFGENGQTEQDKNENEIVENDNISHKNNKFNKSHINKNENKENVRFFDHQPSEPLRFEKDGDEPSHVLQHNKNRKKQFRKERIQSVHDLGTSFFLSLFLLFSQTHFLTDQG